MTNLFVSCIEVMLKSEIYTILGILDFFTCKTSFFKNSFIYLSLFF